MMPNENIFRAVESGNVAELKKIFAEGETFNFRTNYGAKSITLAAEKGYLEILKILFDSIKKSYRETFWKLFADLILMEAVFSTNIELIELLFKYVKKESDFKMEQDNALYYAVKNENILLTTYLIKKGIGTSELNLKKALLKAMSKKNEDLINLLISAGAKFNKEESEILKKLVKLDLLGTSNTNDFKKVKEISEKNEFTPEMKKFLMNYSRDFKIFIKFLENKEKQEKPKEQEQLEKQEKEKKKIEIAKKTTFSSKIKLYNTDSELLVKNAKEGNMLAVRALLKECESTKVLIDAFEAALEKEKLRTATIIMDYYFEKTKDRKFYDRCLAKLFIKAYNSDDKENVILFLEKLIHHNVCETSEKGEKNRLETVIEKGPEYLYKTLLLNSGIPRNYLQIAYKWLKKKLSEPRFLQN